MTTARSAIVLAAAACLAVLAAGCASHGTTPGPGSSTLRNNGECLDVTGPGTGAKAKVAACTGAATQKWAIAQTSANDFGSISNIGTSAVLTDPGGSTTNGTPLVMAPGNGDQSYPWRVSFHPYPEG